MSTGQYFIKLPRIDRNLAYRLGPVQLEHGAEHGGYEVRWYDTENPWRLSHPVVMDPSAYHNIDYLLISIKSFFCLFFCIISLFFVFNFTIIEKSHSSLTLTYKNTTNIGFKKKSFFPNVELSKTIIFWGAKKGCCYTLFKAMAQT